jgi:hypothetical protein
MNTYFLSFLSEARKRETFQESEKMSFTSGVYTCFEKGHIRVSTKGGTYELGSKLTKFTLRCSISREEIIFWELLHRKLFGFQQMNLQDVFGEWVFKKKNLMMRMNENNFLNFKKNKSGY